LESVETISGVRSGTAGGLFGRIYEAE
jgi:hypothetical protein